MCRDIYGTCSSSSSSSTTSHCALSFVDGSTRRRRRRRARRRLNVLVLCWSHIGFRRCSVVAGHPEWACRRLPCKSIFSLSHTNRTADGVHQTIRVLISASMAFNTGPVLFAEPAPQPQGAASIERNNRRAPLAAQQECTHTQVKRALLLRTR